MGELSDRVRVFHDASEDRITVYLFGIRVLPDGSHDRYGTVSSDNGGALVFSTKDRTADEFHVWEATPETFNDGMARLWAHVDPAPESPTTTGGE